MESPRLSLSPPLLEVSFSSFLIFSQRNQSLVCFPVACAWVGGAWLEPGCWRESWKECAPGCALGMEMHAFGTAEERPGPLGPHPAPSLPLRGERLRPRTGGRARRALMSALGYVAAVPASPRRRGSSLGRQALPSFPADAVSTDRSCRSFRGAGVGWGGGKLSC